MAQRIIDLSQPSTPGAPTREEQLATRSAQYADQARNIYRQQGQLFQMWAKWVWQNPLGFTAQQVLDQYAAAAGDLFALAAAYSAMVASYTGVAPASPVPAGVTVAINADGTVTVTMPG